MSGRRCNGRSCDCYIDNFDTSYDGSCKRCLFSICSRKEINEKGDDLVLGELAIAIMIGFQPLPMDYTSDSQVEEIHSGEYKTITYYCEACNTPAHSTVSASGRWVEGYSVASSDYPLGTILYFDGEEHRVDDTGCRSGVVDVLVPSNNGVCNCDNYGLHESEVTVL